MHQASTKFPYLTKMPKKKLMTKRRSISSCCSSLLSSANSFIQRSYGKGELWIGAPKTPKLQDQNSSNETKCVRHHWFSLSKIIRIFGLPKKYWCKNGNGFFHLQWMESLPNLNPFGPPFRPDVHPALFSLPGRRKTPRKTTSNNSLLQNGENGGWKTMFLLGGPALFKGRFGLVSGKGFRKWKSSIFQPPVPFPAKTPATSQGIELWTKNYVHFPRSCTKTNLKNKTANCKLNMWLAKKKWSWKVMMMTKEGSVRYQHPTAPWHLQKGSIFEKIPQSLSSSVLCWKLIEVHCLRATHFPLALAAKKELSWRWTGLPIVDDFIIPGTSYNSTGCTIPLPESNQHVRLHSNTIMIGIQRHPTPNWM